MLQRIRSSFFCKVVAIGSIPGLILPSSLMANVSSEISPSAPISTVLVGGNIAQKNNAIPERNILPESAQAESLLNINAVTTSGVINFQGAKPTGELVDLATGDFNYSIPLGNVGNHPLVLTYDAGVTMHQSASMVGLGWNLNTGAINRVVRGLPDDFKGDSITTEMNLRPNLTIVNEYNINAEAIGLDTDFSGGASDTLGGGIKMGLIFNNYSGGENTWGLNYSYDIFSDAGPPTFLKAGASSSTKSGLSSNLGVTLALGKKEQFKTTLGINKNSLNGTSLNTAFGYDYKTKINDVSKKYGSSLSGTFPVGMQTYTPTATFEFHNRSFTVDVAAGVETPIDVTFHGGYSRTKTTVCLKEKIKRQPAFGYMNQESGYATDALQDFNINLSQVHENLAGINTPMPTGDIFIVTGGGMFQVMRNDAGYVKDPMTKSDGSAWAFSGDAGFGAGFELGVNVNYNWNNSVSGNWLDNNSFSEGSTPSFEYTAGLPETTGTVEDKAKYDRFVFQKVNNRASNSENRYIGMRQETALRQDVYKTGLGEIGGQPYMKSDIDGDTPYFTNLNSYYQVERNNQNEVLVHQTNEELRLSGESPMNSYTLNNFDFSDGDYELISPVNRDASKYLNHHLGELTVLKTGGSKQVYGIPVITETDQVSFNISPISKSESAEPILGGDGMIPYAIDADNSMNNDRGANNYYLKNKVPKHATTFLLTEQLSDDFTDLTGNGPTPDDYGSYTKFNYAYIGITKTRFPYEESQATFNEGFKSDSLDNMANYSYSLQDDWYLHSIETKGFIAEFEYSVRNDAHGSAGENGGLDLSAKSQKLDKIRIYTRYEKEHSTEPLPLKTIHFEYDYSLCPGTPDNNLGSGKLTLKKLYFTGKDSNEGQLHPYEFSYAENAEYNAAHVDRWGNYQYGNDVNLEVTSPLDNSEYPYTIQHKETADQNARKWKLSAIDLPTGSRIEIDYESDSYEYIQNIEATRMFKVDGFYASDKPFDEDKPTFADFSNNLFDPDNKDQQYFYLMVSLEGGISGPETEAFETFQNHYLPHTDDPSHRYLYFNTLLNLAPHNDGIVDPDVYEYIQGYAELFNGGWYLLESSVGSGVWDRVVYRVKPEYIGSEGSFSRAVNPISYKAWQVVKEALPQVLYPEDDLQTIYAKDGLIGCTDFDLEDGESSPDYSSDSKNHKKNIKSIVSVYHMMLNTGYASRAIVPSDTTVSKCWVRMRPGIQSKIGGGYRVKETRIYDNWNDFVAGEESAIYGSTYEYKLEDGTSSGVTSYEPTGSGGDEIALRKPHFYFHSEPGQPMERFYTEFPLNEAMFATSKVVYSRVKVKSIAYPGITLLATGHTIHEHYTAKDFPIRFHRTNIDLGTLLYNPKPLAVAGLNKRRFCVSYGTSTVTNDMHGKFKAKKVFDQGGNIVYQMEHVYRTEEDELANLVPTILPDGTLEDRLIGQSENFMTFLSKSESNNSSVSIKLGFDGVLPPIPSAWPTGNTNENTIFTSLTTKLIHQTGLLDYIKVEDNGRSKSTHNLFFDAKSGAPIVTEIVPEQGDGIRKLYEYVYPAHWAYQNLGLDSENTGIRRINITGTDAQLEASELAYFKPGDEINVFETEIPSLPLNAFTGKFWVLENEATGALFLVDKNGELFDPEISVNYLFKVVNSGNINNTGGTMAAVSSLTGPDGLSTYTPGFLHNKVIAISGLELSEESKLRSACFNIGDNINPYRHNLRGHWKVKNAYSFDGQRDYSSTNSREDGLLTTYQPFWQNVDGTWRKINDPLRPDFDAANQFQDWIQGGEPTKFDNHGFGLETKSPHNLFTSIGTGFNHTVSTYNVANARYEEAVFDGFEDYQSNGVYDAATESFFKYSCHQRHLTMDETKVSSEEAHTGLNSYYVVGPNDGNIFIPIWDGVPEVEGTHIAPFSVQPGDQIPSFHLANDETDNRYVLSVWAKEKNATNPLNNDAAQVELLRSGIALTPENITRSNIIDGWQRIEVIFEVDPTWGDESFLEIQLKAINAHGVYYDDLRIHPYDSEMQASIIDPINARVVATLDNRNYATTYQYDENGALVRMFIETEEGKQTIRENRQGFHVNN